MEPGAWEEKSVGRRRVRGLGSPADGLGRYLTPLRGVQAYAASAVCNLPFLPIRIGVTPWTESGPSHAGARYLNHGRTAVEGPCRLRKSYPDDAIPHPGPTHRGVALSPSVPESPIPLGVPIRPGVRGLLPGSAADADPRIGLFEDGCSVPGTGDLVPDTRYLSRSNAGGRIPGTEPAVRPDGPTAVLAGFRPLRRIYRQSSPVTVILISCILHLASCYHPTSSSGGKP
jgi:hypothetical protein